MSARRRQTLPSAIQTNLPRLALSITEAAEALGVSPDFFAEHVASDLKIVRKGRRKIIAVRELEKWLARNGEAVTKLSPGAAKPHGKQAPGAGSVSETVAGGRRAAI